MNEPVGSQNITLALPRPLLRKVKLLAVEKRTSISGLLTEALEQLVGRDDAFAAARERALRVLGKPPSLGTGGSAGWTRDELHDR